MTTGKTASFEARERTQWHRIVIFGKLGESASKYLKKDSQACSEGRFRTSKWQDESGNDRYTSEIVANEMGMLERKAQNGA